ncbi:MAG: phosphoglucomutase, alpha-D-glucose phosphate-specific [Candidatus Margulisiibacteriota bacterium]
MAERIPGKQAPKETLVDIKELVAAYYSVKWRKRVEFGTSGHRGTSLNGSFNEQHIQAITQAICDYRKAQKITGPLFIGFDTHALSYPAFKTALEVLVANDVKVVSNVNDEFSPTPVISRQIINHNRRQAAGSAELADGIVITPSHNGPTDGGFKYNPPHGGPADTDVTKVIEGKANEYLTFQNERVKMTSFAEASSRVQRRDFVGAFSGDLGRVVDMAAIKAGQVRIGADPLGGSGVHYWEPIAKMYGLDITVVNKEVDPTFGFMTVDSDGTIRMDCSSPAAMAGLIGLKDKFAIAFGNDPDFDRHGIVTPDGLMNPNHYLSVAIWYLMQNRPNWPANLKVGKTLVSSSMIDRVVAGLGKELYEVPVGFKWFVPGLSEGWLAFGGEESAGASFLQLDGQTWTTDKDGFALALLSAEILAKTGQTPSQIYRDVLVKQYGNPLYKRVDGPITDEQKAALKALDPAKITGQVAGLKIVSVLTKAPGNGAPMGGVKVILEDGSWFAIRPSGTEPKMKLYLESWSGEALLARLQAEAPALIFGEKA